MAELTAVITSNVVLIEDGRCLVLEEADDAGERRFNLPGGHVEIGEDPTGGAIREAKEETGFDVELGGLVGVRVNTWSEHHSTGFFFYAKRTGGELKTEEGSIVHWMTLEEIEHTDAEGWRGKSKYFVLMAMRDGYKVDSKAVLMFHKGEPIVW